MNGHLFPLFEHTEILKTAMLAELRDYAYEYGQLSYADMSDGILSGCHITTTVDTIALGRGTIHYQNHIYLITKPFVLAYYPTDIWTAFLLQFKGAHQQDGYICRDVEARLTDQLQPSEQNLELCRFKLQSGAKLRINYVDFADRDTEFDTVNTIYAPFAASSVSSLSPDITRAFAQEASVYTLEPIDTAFCLQALNSQGAMNREAILFYLAVRLGINTNGYDNPSIFKALLDILQQIKGGGQRRSSRAARERRQLLVD